MTKTQLVAAIAEELGVSKKMSLDFVNTFVSTVINSVKKDGEVRIQSFGTFKISHRSARDWVNPKTGAKLRIPAIDVPAFKAGSEFKKSIRG